MAYLVFEKDKPLAEAKFRKAMHYRDAKGTLMVSVESRRWFKAEDDSWYCISEDDIPAEIRATALLLL